jgi:hypothetical protein
VDNSKWNGLFSINMSTGLYNGLDIGNFNGYYKGVDVGLFNGTTNNEVNPKIYLVDSNKRSVVAAYSIRKLSKSYTGPCVRVRRSSDDTEYDVGFNGNGNLDENSLLGFLNGSDGFVSVWFDQSGLSRHAVQSGSTQQPRIALAGVIDKENGKPCLFFDGSNDYLGNNSVGVALSGNDAPKSLICVHKYVNATVNAQLVTCGRSTSQEPILALGTRSTTSVAYTYANRDDVGGASFPQIITNIFANNTTLRMICVYNTGTLGNIVINNEYVANNGNLDMGNVTYNQFAIGALWRSTPTSFANVDIQEVIIYSTDEFQNRSIIETDINKYYKLY